jgi:hypothetical protein
VVVGRWICFSMTKRYQTEFLKKGFSISYTIREASLFDVFAIDALDGHSSAGTQKANNKSRITLLIPEVYRECMS